MELHWKDLEFAAQDVKWDATEMFEELASANPMQDSTTSKVDVLNENTTTHGSGDDIDPSLSLKSMSSKENMESNLDEIEKQLITSMSTNELNIDPIYTVMDIQGLSETSGTEKVSDQSSDITTPMTLGDYDNYDFTDSQVKA